MPQFIHLLLVLLWWCWLLSAHTLFVWLLFVRLCVKIYINWPLELFSTCRQLQQQKKKKKKKKTTKNYTKRKQNRRFGIAIGIACARVCESVRECACVCVCAIVNENMNGEIAVAVVVAVRGIAVIFKFYLLMTSYRPNRFCFLPQLTHDTFGAARQECCECCDAIETKEIFFLTWGVVYLVRATWTCCNANRSTKLNKTYRCSSSTLVSNNTLPFYIANACAVSPSSALLGTIWISYVYVCLKTIEEEKRKENTSRNKTTRKNNTKYIYNLSSKTNGVRARASVCGWVE